MHYRFCPYMIDVEGPGVNVNAHGDAESGIVSAVDGALDVAVDDDDGVVTEDKQLKGGHGILRTWRRSIQTSLGMRN